ncbi:MAG TPA: YitT family protein [Pyrinomonadaceae bacterium]|nr:YitT family protein [Pyrinomonadaceae bacterium]
MKDFLGKIAGGFFLVLGVLSAGLGLKGFLLPLHFIDGGVTGVSMLVSALSKGSLPLLILVINAPFIFIGYRQIGKMFALKSALAIAGLALCLAFLPYPVATNDKLLAAVFGGFFLGAGIGLSIRAGGVLDGTEVMALILSKKMGTTVGDVILLLNIVIFSVAAIFLGLEPALYSVLTYFSVSKTMDFLIHGIEEYNGVTIISARSEEIKGSILNDLGRGITVYKGMGGLTNDEQDILFCVVTRLEIPRLKKVVKEIDEAAFIAVHRISDATGGVMKKQVLH